MGAIRPHTVYYLLHHESRLFGICHAVKHTYFFALLPFGVTFLRDAAFVVGDHAVGGIDYGLGGTIVTLQADYLAVGVVLLEIEYVLDLCSAEGIDGLGIVSDHADITVQHREFLQNDILREVGVLILVHHYIGKARSQFMKGILIIPEQNIHIDQNVVEVHHAGSFQFLLIELVQIRHASALGPAVRRHQILAGDIAVACDQIILRVRDARKDILGLVVLVLIQMQLFQANLHRGSGIRGVVDSELLRITEERSVGAKETHKNGVECPHHHPTGGTLPHHQADAFFHLTGRFLSKSQG